MSSRPGTSSRGQLGDDDEEDEALIAEELAAYKASRAKALADAELDPVLEAAREGDIETVQKLLDEDMSRLNATDMLGRTVMHYAALSGSKGLVASLASAPYTVELDSRDNTGQQAVHQAAKGGHVELAKWLLEVGEVPLTTQDDHKRTIFHEAALHGQLEFLKWSFGFLSERDGIVETERFAFGPDKDHNTCMHFAAQRGNLPVLKWLVKLGMPVVGENLYKKTALDIATRHNHQECVALLKDLTTTELKLRQTEKQVRLLQEKNRVNSRDFGREKARMKDNHAKTEQRLKEATSRCAALEVAVEEKGQRIADLELEVVTLKSSIDQLMAAHKHELSELTAHLEGRDGK